MPILPLFMLSMSPNTKMEVIIEFSVPKNLNTHNFGMINNLVKDK